MLMLSFNFVIVCGLLELTQICAGLLSYFYICINAGDPIIKSGRVVIPITSLTPQPVRACPRLGPGFPVTYIMIFFVYGSLGLEVIVLLILVVIVDHRFLNFLFTT